MVAHVSPLAILAMPDKPAFKDPTSLTRWTKGVLYAEIALSVVAIVSDVMEHALLVAMDSGAYAGAQPEMMAQADASDQRQQIIGILQLIMAAVSAILVLCWIYRANANARALGAAHMRFTPGWAVGWYFIPIANFWKPYQAMKEIWMASANPGDWQNERRSSLLPWWWFLWILVNVLGQILLRASSAAEGFAALLAVNLVSIAADALDIPLDLILIVIIGRIYRMQMDHLARMPKIEQTETGSASAVSTST